MSEHPIISGVTLFVAGEALHSHKDHSHESYSIIVVTSGAKVFRHQSDSAVVREYEIAVSNPGQMHGCSPFENTPWSHKTWYVSQELGQELTQATDRPVKLATPVIRDRELALKLIHAHDQALTADDSFISEEQALETLALLFLGYSAESELSGEEFEEPTVVEQRVRQYCDEMYQSIRTGIELKALSELGGVSRNQVIRDFRLIFGTTPGNYFRNIRLEKAKELLSSGLSLVDTAIFSGFADQSHLTRQFKNAFWHHTCTISKSNEFGESSTLISSRHSQRFQ